MRSLDRNPSTVPRSDMPRRIHRLSLLIVIGLLGGCGVPSHEVARAVSPDGSKVALVYEEEPRGLVQTYTFVYVRPANRDLKKRDLVFQGGDMNGRDFGPVNVTWVGNRTVMVGWCAGYTSIFRNLWADWSRDPEDQVQVQLYQQPEGDWPPSIPLERRAGPPPCT